MTTNDEFMKLIKDNDLTYKEVSRMIEVPVDSIKNWGRTERITKTPAVALVALRLSIQLRDKTE